MADYPSPSISTSATGPETPAELRRIRLFHGVGDEHLARLYPHIHRRQARARATFIMEREFARQVAFVWSGAYRITAVAPSGVSVTLRSPSVGEAFNCSLAVLGYKPGEALRLVVDQPGLLLVMAATELLAAAKESAALSHALLVKVAGLATDYASRVYELAALDVRARLQAELLRLAQSSRRVEDIHVLHHAPTQAALGAQIGATREAVTRHLKDLANEGVIRFRRGVIEFTNLERLRAMDRVASGRVLFERGSSS
jgi:CRP-like cAMP-binding protein